MVAVKDLGKAAQFYEKTLGLNRAGAEDHEAITFESGDTTINMYRSGFAGTNKATAAKGVTFEHYDLPNTRREGDVHLSGDMKVAWFKDPDGNILSVANR